MRPAILRQSSVATDLHLCNNYRHLLISLASIAGFDRPATVIYLEDELPIPLDLRRRLSAACPLAEFIFTRDADQMAAFARLPKIFPAIFRRNLTLGGCLGVKLPRNWEPPLLAGRRFATGYLYHSGFFLSKVVAGLCNHVVLRESGLNNYARLRVPPLKAGLRWLAGLPPRHQVWGEEPWVDRIEVSHPTDLPQHVRAKAHKLTFSDIMDMLPPTKARAIAAAFISNVPSISDNKPHTAILLTQPIDKIGICTLVEKQQLYEQIGWFLTQAGYQVHVKSHPLETPVTLPGAVTLPPTFPVEAWPYFSDQKFTLAVALCSASLVGGARAFAHQTIQLLPPSHFNVKAFTDWSTLIPTALATVPRVDEQSLNDLIQPHSF